MNYARSFLFSYTDGYCGLLLPVLGGVVSRFCGGRGRLLSDTARDNDDGWKKKG